MALLRSLGFYALYAVLCVYCHPTKEASTDLQFNASEVHDLQITAAGSASKDISTDGLPKLTKTDLQSLASVLIPLKLATRPKNGFTIMALPVEPDAEMLPAHYTGVKPPGVDHMELRLFDSETLESQPKVAYIAHSHTNPAKVANSAVRASAFDTAIESAKSANGGSKAHVFEKGSKGSSGRRKQETQNSEAAGTRKQYSDEAEDSGDHGDQAQVAGGARYGHFDDHNREHNSMGYHHVYHKDEQKRIADYYKNDNHGGKFKKHGRYNEKHLAHETDYKKGTGKSGASSADASGKKGMSEKAEVTKETGGHQVREAYDQYSKNFKGFGQQGDSVKGGKSGFAHAKELQPLQVLVTTLSV